MQPVKQDVLRVHRKEMTCILMSKRGNKYQALVQPQCADLRIGDIALVVKDNLTGEWVVVDYIINTDAWKDVTLDESCTLEDWV